MPFSRLRAARARVRPRWMFSAEVVDWDVPASRSFSEDEESLMGRPKPFAKEGGSAKPARPKRVISAVPMRIARHSAGGGRLAKRLRVVDDILGGSGGVTDGYVCCDGNEG